MVCHPTDANLISDQVKSLQVKGNPLVFLEGNDHRTASNQVGDHAADRGWVVDVTE